MTDYVITPLPEDDDISGIINYLELYIIEMLNTNEKRFNHFANCILLNNTSGEQLEELYVKALSKVPVYRIHRVFRSFILHSNAPIQSLRYLLHKINVEKQTTSPIISSSYELIYSDLQDFIMESPAITNYKRSIIKAGDLELESLLPEWDELLFGELGLELET